MPERDTAHIDFPFRFTEGADLVLTEEERGIDNNIRTATFIRKNGVPLVDIGTTIEQDVFEPNDLGTQFYLADLLTQSVEENIENILIDESNIQFEQEQHTLRIKVPYMNTRTQKLTQVIMSVPKSRSDQ